MNFSGKSRDVMTLAHEMGHGVHQIFASKQGYLMSDTINPCERLVFAEMLAFRRLVDSHTNDNVKRCLLLGKLKIC